MINVEKIKPSGLFTNYIFKAIPLAFDESMSYYETLCGLLSYLKDTIIPALNNNADAIMELENLITELHNYVEHYFDNLDVQEEINNKLDDMAESGQLTDIIAQYLQLAGILAYNTVDDMINATNLVDGSFARTYGLTSYNDGKGAFYKIRTITNDDIVDGVNIIAVNFSNTIIAEKMPDYYIDEINNSIEDISEDVEDINENIGDINESIEDITSEINLINSEKTIIIGDSYALDRRPSINITGWAIPLQELLGLSNNDCSIVQDNGGGFTVQGSNGTFLESLQNLTFTDNTQIKNIIVCGGLNDIQASDTATIKSAISSFMSYVKTNFVNAKVYIGMIGWNLDDAYTSDNQLIRYKILTRVLPAYQDCNEYGAIYLNGVENVMHDKTQYYDGAHPNQTMCERLARYIYQAYKNGYASVTYPEHVLSFDDENITTDYFSISERIINNETIIFDNHQYGNGINYTSDYPTVGNYNIYVGKLNTNYITSTYTWDELFTCSCIATDVNDVQYQCVATAVIKYYNFMYVRFYNNTSIEGKQLKEINFLSPYSNKPTVTH